MPKMPVLVATAWLIGLPLHAQQFGSYVSVGDGTVLVSEPIDPSASQPNESAPRSLHVYERSASGWEKSGTIQAPPHEGGDYFGRFVAADDRSLLVGGTVYHGSTGAVWAYRKTANGWEFDAIVQPAGIGEGTSFGRFGHLHGDELFVTSLAHGGGGAVFVFERDAGGSWIERGTIRPAEATEGQYFGWGLDYDGERLIVGSLESIQQLSGAAYVFSRDDSGAWVQEARLALPEDESEQFDAGPPQNPGVGVAWFRGMALLGLPGRNGLEGAVLAFRRRPLTGDWVRESTLTAFDAQFAGFFGYTIETVDGELWVSAPGASGAGAVYRFRYDSDTGGFASAAKLLPRRDADAGDAFGISIASAGPVAAVGQPGDDKGLGSVLVLEKREGAWVETAKLFVPEERRPLAALSDVSCGPDSQADQFGCSQVDILSFLPLDAIGGGGRGVETNDVWGWTDPQTGREYAIVGRTDGTAFVDVSDPLRPVYLGSLPKTRGSITNSWRDIKVHANHAFIVADNAGEHGMQVFDLTRLREVRTPPVDFTVDALYEGISSAHNIVINEATGVAYSVGSSGGGETCGGGLHMIDIGEPKHPTFVGCFQDPSTGIQGTGYTHDAMCILYDGPDTEHVGKEICFGSNETALSIADVTDKSAPVALATASYPNVGYSHQGWITEDHRYFYMDDEIDEMNAQAGTAPAMSGTRTLIWDVSDLDDPVLAKEHFGETFTIDHNLYIVGDLMYQSNYVSGLRILDISDRENPKEVGFLDTVPWDESVVFDGSWSNYPFFASGTIVVSSGKEGVFFLKFRRPELVP